MKAGKEYELFVYEKFKSYYATLDVTLNDKIFGRQSGIKREIDVSIKGKFDDIDVLYLVQCKDYTRPADVNIIGAFSAVIKDVGATKGFLICSAGFTKSIHQYAMTLGIELLSIEDIMSEKWKAKIEIPVIYIQKYDGKVNMKLRVRANAALVEKNKRAIQITQNDLTEISLNNGETSISILDYLNYVIETEKIDISKTKELELTDPNLMLKFSDIWTRAEFRFQFSHSERFYLKFITPDEYSHIVDHVNRQIQPLNLTVKGLGTDLDSSFVQIGPQNIPVSSYFKFEIEENLTPFTELNFQGFRK